MKLSEDYLTIMKKGKSKETIYSYTKIYKLFICFSLSTRPPQKHIASLEGSNILGYDRQLSQG